MIRLDDKTAGITNMNTAGRADKGQLLKLAQGPIIGEASDKKTPRSLAAMSPRSVRTRVLYSGLNH